MEIRPNTKQALEDGNLKEILETRFDGKVLQIDSTDVIVTILMDNLMYIPFGYMQKKRNGAHKKGRVVQYSDFLNEVVEQHKTRITPEQAIAEVIKELEVGNQ